MTDADDGAPKEDHSDGHGHEDLIKHESESLDDVDYADMHDFDPTQHFDPLKPLPSDDPDHLHNHEVITNATPSTELEIALKAELDRQIRHNEVLVGECTKLRVFISKRKQTYKRKRKDEGAPRKKLSGYNLFVRERFAEIARANEDALRSADSGAELKRIPPASNIASSGHAWSQLSAEEKARYNEMAKPDEDRYEKESADYVVPEKVNRKRNKTGYNLFFSKHVQDLRQNHNAGIPAERGSTARIVADAWKEMSAEEKDEFEQQAVEHNSNMIAAEQQPLPLHHPQSMNATALSPPGALPPEAVVPLPLPGHMYPPPPMADQPLPVDDGGLLPPPPNVAGDPGGPPDWPPTDYGMHGPPPPPIIHQPPGYDPYGYPPYDPYGYVPNYQGQPPPPYPPGMPPPPGYGPPPGNYQGPPPPHV